MQFQMQVGDPGKKTSGRQIDGEKGREGAMQFQCKQGLQGRKHQGHQIDGEKGREMRHAVSSESRGSSEENVRGAKLMEKRTRGAPCSFKCK